MPEAEKRQTPPGQAYGEATKQRQFLAESAQKRQAQQPVQLPVEEPVAEMTPDVAEVLLGATQRPDEPVTHGLPNRRPERLQDVVARMVVASGGSPDLVVLHDELTILGF